MIYEYQAIDKKGKKTSDLIDAPSELSAKQKLRAKGLYVTGLIQHDVKQEGDKTQSWSSINNYYEKAVEYFSLKLNTKEVGIFSRQLSILLKAGMPLLTAITDIIEQIENKNFKRIVVDIKEKLEEGSSLSNCLARHDVVFSEMYVNMVRVGENLGSLDTVIERLAEIAEKQNMVKSKIQSAMYYPAFMGFFTMAVIIFLLTSAVPSLERMFSDMDRELPLPTQIVIGVSDLLTSYYFLAPFFIILISFLYWANHYIKTPEGRTKLDGIKLKLPLLGVLYKKTIILNFTQNLGILLNNRVDILKSFEIVRKIVKNTIIESQIEEVSKKVREGSTVSSALSKSEFLPKMVLGMIAAGEASDQLDEMLIKIGNAYETEFDLAIAGLTSIIEPIMMLILGAAIGMIIISIMMPIFEMNLMV